ncbi:hypothetical protein A9P82_13120 [Arachidicoccus ginsenosidimutans]|uniref:hypothetical protein n=1 Tax=Arachidicoccus sp. BS20 TaxID=1850526 RepID=UPI0007F12D43|nr:hypothetical protein [Arachidicoccus sp. BS20]ANI90143.1 hypothetical protein A9P82_13120 [Arachidicoccus sp. BS20]
MKSQNTCIKVVALIFTCLLLITSVGSFAQNRKKKKHGFTMPTMAQQESYKTYLKKMLGDSVNIPLAKRDTVASIELANILKKMKVNADKSVAKEDKDVQNGMLDDDMYMQLGAILSVDELQRLQAFEQRQKAAAEAAEKERKDKENQSNFSPMNRGYGYGGYGYGGYGGYY